MEAHGGERRYSSYSYLTSALDGGEWWASRPGRALPPGKEPLVPIGQEAGWAPEPVWMQRLEEKFSTSVGDRTPVVQSAVRHYWLSYGSGSWLIVCVFCCHFDGKAYNDYLILISLQPFLFTYISLWKLWCYVNFNTEINLIFCGGLRWTWSWFGFIVLSDMYLER
jgi:hypothetical protein